MRINATINKAAQLRQGGFSMIEVVFAGAIAALVLAGMFRGYSVVGQTAQYSACNLAANACAMRQLEQIVAADWIPSYNVTELFSSTLTVPQTGNLCLPSANGNVINCTNYATITQVSASPPYAMVQVQCVWSYPYGGTATNNQVFTNTVAVLRAPNI